MPLDPNNPHADTPHARTVHLASQGWRYGCSSERAGDDRPRVRVTDYIARPCSKFGGVRVTTQWLPIPCGHTTRATDAACAVCQNRERA